MRGHDLCSVCAASNLLEKITFYVVRSRGAVRKNLTAIVRWTRGRDKARGGLNLTLTNASIRCVGNWNRGSIRFARRLLVLLLPVICNFYGYDENQKTHRPGDLFSRNILALTF